MAAQRPKKNFPHKFLAFLNVYYPKTNLIKTLNYLDSSRSNGSEMGYVQACILIHTELHNL